MKVDAVMILSIDGRPHLEQARPVFAARKPVFIDKPVASSLAEIVQVFREAEQSGTPCFSNSRCAMVPRRGESATTRSRSGLGLRRLQQ